MRGEGVLGRTLSLPHPSPGCPGHLLPKRHFPALRRGVAGAVHGRHVPAGAEEVDGFGEAVVVDEARVHREEPHQQEDVPAAEEHAHDLRGEQRAVSTGAHVAGAGRWVT